METNSLDTVYCWAKKQFASAVYEQDIEPAKIAAVLLAVCINNEPQRNESAHKIKELDGIYGLAQTRSDSLHADIQYLMVYHLLTGQWPKGIEEIIDSYSSVITEAFRNYPSNELLKAILLLAQADKADLAIIPVSNAVLILKRPVSAYLLADKKQLEELLAAIDAYTCFGQRKHMELPDLLISVLEVRLLATLRDFDLQLTCGILKALNYLGHKDSRAMSAAVKFLVHNQNVLGLYGYCDQEFKMINQQIGDCKRSYLLASALQMAITLREQTNYRFYSKMLLVPPVQQLNHEMVVLVN
ncbi:hypothetical protein [Pedobacter cryoconitis]|uniref:Uncharacterized protein n=1 Tax=Pedobacter cryoconitis TaxID=188932 RepID=A0A7X0J1G2_9SPHI|nr:hypothetical protein [Pedobacter cryoconitis]MBB6499185.1 hypothetical protein [Pedobacter cryoconitis]